MTNIITISILTVIAALSNALMDLSSENRLGKRTFWNKGSGSKNKWKNGDPKQGESFPLSSTALVFLTDGWHLLQFLFHTSWQLAVSISFEKWLVAFLITKCAFSFIFEITYRNIKK